jgi:hypothetical protein
VALLEPLALALQLGQATKPPVFLVQVQRRSAAWSRAHPFESFEALHAQLLLALQHGHLCSAGCPWLFSLLTSEFPKRHLFQRNASPRTAEARRRKLLQVLSSTLEFLLDRKNHTCSVATTDVAKLLAEFLYGEDKAAEFIVESYSEAETTSSNDSSRRRSLGVLCNEEEEVYSSSSSTELMLCGVCKAPVACEAERKGPRASSASPVNASSRRRSSVYATVLQCGHQFHDECIVPVLNETLRCPTCHHVEIEA